MGVPSISTVHARARRAGPCTCAGTSMTGIGIDNRTLTTLLSAIYLVSMMLALGLELGAGPRESKEKKRAKRRMLARGLLFNLIAIPALAFLVTRALHASSDVAIALLILAAVPGGRYAPHLVKLGAGEVTLAIEVTLFLAKLTAFTAAPTAKWLLTLHTLDIRELPFLLQLLLLQIVPLYGGKWLRRRHRPLADRLLRPAQWIAIATLLGAFASVLLRDDRGLDDLLRDRSWLAVGVVGIAAPLLGWLVGGPDEGNRRALAIGANSRELGLALVIATVAFPEPGVHTALFGIWSMYAIASFLLAAGMRTYGRAGPGASVKAEGRAPAAAGAVRSGPAH
jgi:BASS family bile acid:Na+ symporter